MITDVHYKMFSIAYGMHNIYLSFPEMHKKNSIRRLADKDDGIASKAMVSIFCCFATSNIMKF